MHVPIAGVTRLKIQYILIELCLDKCIVCESVMENTSPRLMLYVQAERRRAKGGRQMAAQDTPSQQEAKTPRH